VNGDQKARKSGGKGCCSRSCIGRARGCWKEPEGRLKTPPCTWRFWSWVGWLAGPVTGAAWWPA